MSDLVRVRSSKPLAGFADAPASSSRVATVGGQWVKTYAYWIPRTRLEEALAKGAELCEEAST